MSELPTDPDAQFHYGLTVLQNAMAAKAAQLQSDTARLHTDMMALQQKSVQQDGQIAQLEAHVSQVSTERDAFAQENERLKHDNAQLGQHIGSLTAELERLKQFKSVILNSVNDDVSYPAAPPPAAAMYQPPMQQALAPQQQVPTSQYIPAPVNTPAPITAASSVSMAQQPVSPSSMSRADLSPVQSLRQPAYSAAPATVTTPGAGVSFGASQGASTPKEVLDGKDFFRQARQKLTYESFNAFLNNIKKLNNHAQSRDETLQQAQVIFGDANQDLYESFSKLLLRHGTGTAF